LGGHAITPTPPSAIPLPPPPSTTPLKKPMHPPPTLIGSMAPQQQQQPQAYGDPRNYLNSSPPVPPQSIDPRNTIIPPTGNNNYTNYGRDTHNGHGYRIGFTPPPIPSTETSDGILDPSNICGNQNHFAPDVIHIEEVEWADPNATGNPPEQALRPKETKVEDGDPCGCEPIWDEEKQCYDKSKPYCLSDECVLYACQEECRSNCSAGVLCKNRRITDKQWKRVQVFDAGLKGRGLMISEPAKKGDLISEYCGIAIKRQYLDMLFRRYKLERMLYIMALDNDTYIDARKKGGLARYINHSCDPNCAVHRWTVRGILRAGIFAIRDIEAGEELSFDYHWKRKRGRAPTKCYCKSPICRGTLEDLVEKTDEDEEFQEHWKEPPLKKGGVVGREIMNRTVKVYQPAEEEYCIADVGQYDDNQKMHCLIYRGETEESWTDLSQERWMILDEEMEKYVIAKKERSTPQHSGLNTFGTIGIGGALADQDNQQKFKKNYVIVPTIVKERIFEKHLVDRCQRYFRVQISVLKCNMEDESTSDSISELNDNGSSQATTDKTRSESPEDQGWKFTINGLEPIKALEYLEKNVSDIYEEFGRSDPLTASKGGNRNDPIIEIQEQIFRHEIVIPRCVLDQTKSRMPLLRNNCKGAEISFTHSTSLTKQFAKLIVESTDEMAAQSAQIILWKDLLTLCNGCNAPRTATGLFKDLAFLGGELTIQEFELLNPKTPKTSKKKSKKGLSIECSEDVGVSSGLAAFEDMHRCTVWVQSIEDMGRINSQNKIVTDCNSIRKIFFGCEPSRIMELWGHVKSRVADNSRGVRHFQMEADRYYLPVISRNFDQRSHGMPVNFFDYVSKMSGSSIRIDTFSRNHIRLDGHEYSQNSYINSSPHIKAKPEDRMGVAQEIIQLQIELLRDNTIRHHKWIFGRDWSLSVPDAPRKSDPGELQPVSPTPVSRLDHKRSTAAACFEIAEIADALKLDTAIAGHASVILYRYFNLASEQFKTNLSQAKLRDLSLACLFLANKCQKARKWKRLEVMLEAAYKTFYSGAQFDDNSEEARSWEKRVLAAEEDIISTLKFDIFWSGTEWVTTFAVEAGQVAGALADSIMDLSLSGPSLAAGPQLWLKLGPEYVYVTIAALMSVNIEKLLSALSVSPVKLMTAMELMCNHILTQKSNKSRGVKSIHQIFNLEESVILSTKDDLKRLCKNRLAFGAKPATNQINYIGPLKQYEIISRRCRRRMILENVDYELLKKHIIPCFARVKAQSACNLYVEEGAEAGLENVILEGNWRALASAEKIIKQSIQRVDVEIDIAAKDAKDTDNSSDDSKTPKSAKLSFQSIPNADSKSSYFQQYHGKYDSGTIEMSALTSGKGWSGIESMGGWDGSTGGKSCISSQILSSSLHEAGLRWWSWWMNPPICLNQNGILCNVFNVRETYGGDDSFHLSQLGKIAKSIRTAKSGGHVTGLFQRLILQSSENGSSVQTDDDNDSFPVSLQRWPSEKCEAREQSKGGMGCGFSPSALQEMQLLSQLHFLIPLPQGHPNFVLPITIAADVEKDDEGTNETSKLSDIVSSQTSDDIFSYLQGDSHKKKEKTVELKGNHIVFQPMPIVLQKVFSKCKRRRGDADFKPIPPLILLSWFHDLLTAVAHCHTNNIVLRTLHPDQIMIDHNGVAKLSGMTRTIVIPKEERGKYLDPLANVRNKNKKASISEEDMNNNLYVAPELLLGGSRYNKESDIWTIGSVMAHMVLSKPMFSGRDRQTKMHAIFKIIGTPTSSNYKEAEEYPYYDKCRPSKKYKKGVEKAIRYMLKDGNEGTDSYKGILSLLEQMLVLDPRKRITAAGALEHSAMTDFMNQTSDEEFRSAFIEEWMSFKEYILDTNTRDGKNDSDDAGMFKGSSYKRSSFDTFSAFGNNDIDDLYNLDGLTGSKRQKLGF